MRPYLEFLQGKRKRTKDYTYHKKANKLVRELREDYTCEEIADAIDNTSETTIQSIDTKNYRNVSTDYARNLYYWIKSAMKDGNL